MKIAFPYYHRLVLPLYGLARLFFIACVDTDDGQVVSCRLQTFDPQDQSLGDWLAANRVDGLFSGDSPPWLLDELERRGIWHRQTPAGEPLQILGQWLRQGPSSARPAASWLLSGSWS
ncbi:hypothetical protein EDC39_11330 [Geothermobacter ehrlichii]|uniref:Dinitrogenase iron-molybdenum cofactor n=1 Tax=Geothermobacter ehrlichii TaxID=213224 RepID=A0A5D3WH61_9BACT|nr:hypothetical protein [Geothermobacter ehrlichii]TYO96641.1 hypothetical protein EDC39_11330 [Geothermobacter ehrlichii]